MSVLILIVTKSVSGRKYIRYTLFHRVRTVKRNLLGRAYVEPMAQNGTSSSMPASLNRRKYQKVLVMSDVSLELAETYQQEHSKRFLRVKRRLETIWID